MNARVQLLAGAGFPWKMGWKSATQVCYFRLMAVLSELSHTPCLLKL